MRIFDFVNQDRLCYPMDELPPSGLQSLNSGFRLVPQMLSSVQSRNFLHSALKSYSVLKWSYRPDYVSIQSVP